MKCTILSPWNQIDNCTLKGSLNHFKISSMNGLIRDLSSNRKPAFSSSSQLASWNDRPKNDLKKWRFPTTLDTKKYDFKKWWREKKTFCQKKGEKKKIANFSAQWSNILVHPLRCFHHPRSFIFDYRCAGFNLIFEAKWWHCERLALVRIPRFCQHTKFFFDLLCLVWLQAYFVSYFSFSLSLSLPNFFPRSLWFVSYFPVRA